MVATLWPVLCFWLSWFPILWCFCAQEIGCTDDVMGFNSPNLIKMHKCLKNISAKKIELEDDSDNTNTSEQK